MSRCPVCGGVVNGLGDCIECGLCTLCYPFECVCEYYEELDEEADDYWLKEWACLYCDNPEECYYSSKCLQGY